MHTRRGFLARAAGLSGAAALNVLTASIQRAAAIAADPGSTYLDAEHVVILMQENRSFDHAFGTLRGVRGFDDPRAITLPDGNPVWVQANAAGKRYVPFRLDINDTNATWMGSLPHGWTDQTDARHHGRYDRWLIAKRPGARQYAHMPLTMGHYTRADIPFYYALADAFTVCDQHFCSSLTGTTPNRCFLWTGTVREKPGQPSPAVVRNEECDYGRWQSWATFPERLEDHGISWKIYQNELSIPTGLNDDEEGWLANFGDNPIEYFTQFHVRLAANRRRHLEAQCKSLPGEIAAIEKQLGEPRGNAASLTKRLAELKASLKKAEADRVEWTQQKWDQLSARAKRLHERAFDINTGDPFYRQLAEIAYRDGDQERKVKLPKGDVLHQFRQDVNKGTLPTVSWIVAPRELSDHPTTAWYGAWYLAEVMNILTHNPAVWKKTIFILTYDENDGYFDHVPPFVVPHPSRPETGKVSEGIDAGVEFVELADDLKRSRPGSAREGPIGLGYRVPMIIASPWSRGGAVCSQVFDHTSSIQFLEKLLSHKTGKKVEEPNISRWRRVVCGDLTSAFRAPGDQKGDALPYPKRDAFVEGIHKAQFKGPPTNWHALSDDEVSLIRKNPAASKVLPRQEPGTRPSAPLPYELAIRGNLDIGQKHFTISFAARNEVFRARAAGAPFTVYAMTKPGEVRVRNYAVEAGKELDDRWALADFADGNYHLCVHGPNGFYREFRGSAEDPIIEIEFSDLESVNGAVAHSDKVAVTIRLVTKGARASLTLRDNAYGNGEQQLTVDPDKRGQLVMPTKASHGWYDFSVELAGHERFLRRFAGRVETGRWSTSDPVVGRARA